MTENQALTKGDPLDLEVTDISHEGHGIGHAGGLTVFVPNTVPGDQVMVRIEVLKSRYAVARLIKRHKPSPDRIEPGCIYAADCGGCTLQTLAYGAQLNLKQRQVREALTRIGKITNIDNTMRPILGMADPWHYRSKVQLPVSGTSQEPKIGVYAPNSHDVVDARICKVQPPVCDNIRSVVRDYIRTSHIEPYCEQDHTGLLRHLVIRLGFATGDVMVGLVLNGTDITSRDLLIQNLVDAIGAHEDPALPPLHLTCCFLNRNTQKGNTIQTADNEIVYGQGWIDEKILNLTYRISPQAFFQVNPRQTEKLFEQVIEMANLQGNENVLDLYCGTGSISLQLAKKARKVLGIEIVEAALREARDNARLNDLSNADFLAGQAEKLLPQLAENGWNPDLIVLDPPRKGCERAVIDSIVTMQTKRIVYVSCNPATLARDAAILQEAGYRIQAVQPVDLFPWTNHVETVVLITRAKE